MSDAMWGGRFSKGMSHLMLDFHSSLPFDYRLYPWDIEGSIAHGKMLTKIGVLTEEEGALIVDGLIALRQDIEEGRISLEGDDEDIHMCIERLLTERIGPVAKKIHTGRSRNDQVATDLKLYLYSQCDHMKERIKTFIGTLLALSEQHIDVVMPGYTHAQRAQAIHFSHHLMAYVQMMNRDYKSLVHWQELHKDMPLGSGALAGTTFPLDRHYTAELLGFTKPCANSMDGVSDRDFVLDYLYIGSKCMMHLSRLCEELILWSTQEFQFIELDDAYSSGSSIMPQKKNPDVAELVRGKSGRVYGHLIGLLTTLKGLPLAYNKDMQEDKEGLFDTVETLEKCFTIMTELMSTMTVNGDAMKEATKKGYLNATDLADYLAKKGLPFRDAHHVVGELVAYGLSQGKALEDLSYEELQRHCAAIEEDVYEALSLEAIVEGRNTYGGTSKKAISEAIQEIKAEYDF